MKVYTLSINYPVDPVWLRKSMGTYDLEINTDGEIELNNQMLRFREPSPAPGTKVRVWFSRDFECTTLEDIQERDRQHQLQREQEKQAYKDKQNRWRDEAVAFNSQIQLPVKWGIGEKLVLSGLSKNSWGDGRNKASVNHIVLHEDMHIGRLKRKNGDLLCSKDTGNYSSFHDFKDESVKCVDGEGKSYQPKVTCKCCVKILEKLKAIKQVIER